VKNERIPYDVWERVGQAPVRHAGPGDRPPGDLRLHHQGHLEAVRLQRSAWTRTTAGSVHAAADEGRLGDKQIVSVGQGKKLSEAFKFIEILIAHRGCVMTASRAGLELRERRAAARSHSARSGSRSRRTKRIDGAVATAMAISN
jgi:hypothetical protein